MAPATPTRREIVLVSLLLLCILFFTRHNYHPPNNSIAADTLQPPSSPPVYPESRPRVSYDTRLSWKTSAVPETAILAHVPGWTIFDKLYILKGIIYVVTDEPQSIPDISFMISKGIFIKPGAAAEATRLPSDKELRIISTKEARELFGTGAQIIDGVTFLVNDPPQFITHYYHWSAELWFGLWRTYTSLDPSISADGNTTLPPAQRLMFSNFDAHHWRDYASMNQWVVRTSFPSVTMEFIDDWRDRTEMGRPFVFERVILADPHRLRTVCAPGSTNWWMTIRNNVVQFAGLDPAVGGGTTSNPVITYISRQKWGRRMLIKEDHEKLVRELYKLRDTYGYEVNIVAAEKMTRLEQLQLAARTTIMMGVHGNGLTSLVWMNPSPRSTVIEFFFPGGFAHDYEYTTRAMGMVHYGFWGSEYFTSPGVPTPSYPDGFQGNAIPIDGEAVARLCVDRLTLSVEVDD
ncbi:hypothetical protein BD779DRAFT_1528535 [Infundibulicybe gibba]|nr:hypothetical protein BD779DRAFT_1528535 [Infundibulicybe gibba]